MNRWQAITEIVRLFVDRGHPGFALAALLSILASLIGLALIVAYGGAGLTAMLG